MGRGGTFLRANREIWEQKTHHHVRSKFYDVPAFLRGASTLHSVELDALGSVRDKRLLHLMCHFGLDSLSWARLGASVVGVDFAPSAVAFANDLAQRLELDAEFVCCNVYDAPRRLKRARFDVVFMSYGVLGWLPDLRRLMRAVASCVRRGGTFFIVDFHPVFWMLDDRQERVAERYDGAGEPIVSSPRGSYAAPRARLRGKEYWWNHGLGSIVNAVLDAGLSLDELREYPYAPYEVPRHRMVEVAKGRWAPRASRGKTPVLFSLQARRR
jgi:SAM-dependent methyltransferase